MITLGILTIPAVIIALVIFALRKNKADNNKTMTPTTPSPAPTKKRSYAWLWLVGGIMAFVVYQRFCYLPDEQKAMEAAKKQQIATPAQTEKVQLPLCAGGDYNFSKEKIPGKVVVAYRPDCISEVTLPARCVYRTEPSSDVKITFIDGSSYIGGPDKRIWFGIKRGIFKVQGVKDAGTIEIFLEKKD